MTEPIDYFGTGKDAGDNSFLSNFYMHGGWSVEHHYQAAKTLNPYLAAKILAAPTPNIAKKLGRVATLREDWEDVKDSVMLTLLRMKFSIREFGDKLLATGDAELIEGNWWGDRYWGKVNGEGMNMLGRMLMQVRDELKWARELAETEEA